MPTIVTRATSSPGTTGCTGVAHATLASVSPVQMTVVTKPATDDVKAAAAVVRRDHSPNNSGKKNVAAIIATAYETIERMSCGVRSARSSDTRPTPKIASRE